MEKINLLPKEEREGQIITPAYKIPTDIKGIYIFRAMLDVADLEDEKLLLKLDVDVSNDGIKWRYFGGIVYKGGKYPSGKMPGFGFGNVASLQRKYVRVRYEINKRMQLGAEIDHEDITAVHI